MMEIMGKTKKDNPIRRGWMEKTRPNHYRTTALGQAEAERLRKIRGEVREASQSAQKIYDAIAPYINHRVFVSHCKDPSEPRMWLGAASLLGLSGNDKLHLEDRFRAVSTAIEMAKTWMDENGQTEMHRGVTGGGIAIRRTDVQRLQEFVEILKGRFKVQIDAILKT
jgi:hypothetical protein